MRNLIIRWLRLDERYLTRVSERVYNPGLADVTLFNDLIRETSAELEAASKPVGLSPEVIEEIWRIGMAAYADYGPSEAAYSGSER